MILFGVLITLSLTACVTGKQIDYYDAEGHIYKTEEKHVGIMQMQTRPGSNSIYSEKVGGFTTKIPIPFTGSGGFSFLEVTMGYIGSTRLLLEDDAVVIVDTNINPFDKGGVTDTVLHGGKATEDFYSKTIKEIIRKNNLEEDDGTQEREQGQVEEKEEEGEATGETEVPATAEDLIVKKKEMI